MFEILNFRPVCEMNEILLSQFSSTKIHNNPPDNTLR